MAPRRTLIVAGHGMVGNRLVETLLEDPSVAVAVFDVRQADGWIEVAETPVR